MSGYVPSLHQPVPFPGHSSSHPVSEVPILYLSCPCGKVRFGSLEVGKSSVWICSKCNIDFIFMSKIRPTVESSEICIVIVK
ncbi:hypothetical protein CCACVL1_09892 [Corchorus capsularis]|uniref:Uncharacterized protein n=1 Tax=Corchorus capsularis TaxID=210143 RepID=A0A1R3ITW6_COCAP|nr:hypothetical protein CCACVL1_09892 [Corchorus capsularis]